MAMKGKPLGMKTGIDQTIMRLKSSPSTYTYNRILKQTTPAMSIFDRTTQSVSFVQTTIAVSPVTQIRQLLPMLDTPWWISKSASAICAIQQNAFGRKLGLTSAESQKMWLEFSFPLDFAKPNENPIGKPTWNVCEHPCENIKVLTATPMQNAHNTEGFQGLLGSSLVCLAIGSHMVFSARESDKSATILGDRLFYASSAGRCCPF